jgi:hypothetical protein
MTMSSAPDALKMSDSYSPGTLRLRTVVLPCLAAVVAFAVTFAFVRSQTGRVSNGHAPPMSPVVGAKAPLFAAPAPSNQRVHADGQPNPAEQKPGPPDPEAQKASIASAERAAQAAADLAASQ